MTDTKMKTLGELAKELRGCASTRPDSSGIGRIEAEAADRLERIERAWERYNSHPSEGIRDLEHAIEEEP